MARGELALKAPADEAAERLQIEAARKDPRRFADLYEENFERVYAFVVRRVRDRDQAQDLTADVFHRALAGLPRFEYRGIPFAAWLFQIARNAIADDSKRSVRQRKIADFSDAPEAIENEVEPRARLFKLVDELPEDQRRVIAMRFGEQQTIKEIAARLGRSEGAIKQLQLRGLQKLKARMGDSNG
jgi:RNA polymerase sigma-70 factor (ECF subfamily)